MVSSKKGGLFTAGFILFWFKNIFLTIEQSMVFRGVSDKDSNEFWVCPYNLGYSMILDEPN